MSRGHITGIRASIDHDLALTRLQRLHYDPCIISRGTHVGREKYSLATRQDLRKHMRYLSFVQGGQWLRRAASRREAREDPEPVADDNRPIGTPASGIPPCGS
ncbi:hypothetical protein MYX84_08175 [Acidobacteria bacterium AH-259-O06]|nr:hypothetical protein [Acidobacteria bacterium AH-259-O06]